MKLDKICLFILACLIPASCADLNYTEENTRDEEWTYEYFGEGIKNMVFDVYAQVYNQEFEANSTSFLAGATDEAMYALETGAINSYTNGGWSVANPFSTTWDKAYTAISEIHMYLEKIDKADISEWEHNANYETWIQQMELFPYELRFLRAYFYFELFKTYGDVPLVTTTLTNAQANSIKRTPAAEIVQFIVDEIDEVAPHLPVTYATEAGTEIGRATRVAAYALKARTLLYAASPLFNSKDPYMNYTPGKTTEFTNIEHVWFGKEDPTLWNRCLQACEDFFKDNEANGNYYQLIQPVTQDEAGYRMAFRNAYRYRNDENNHEKLFDAHPTQWMSSTGVDGVITENGWGWGWKGFAIDGVRQGGAVPTNELMECFGLADGTNFPYEDIYGAGKNPEGIDIFADRDPRLYETITVPRKDFPSGVVGDYNGFKYIDTWVDGAMANDAGNFGDLSADAATHYRKFKWLLDYSGGKMDDEFIGVSYIRLAEMYLIYAEALAETGNLQGALDQIHVVRSRVGLGRLEQMNPELNLTTNKENLINEILRERNCEIGAECGDRVYDMIRRKRQDLFTKTLHEIRVYRLDENGNRMTGGDQRWDPNTPWPKFEYEKPAITVGARRWWDEGYWTNKWYLDPVSRVEIQKGYGLTQNPGW